MSDASLVALLCCDLGAITRGRAVPADAVEELLAAGVGWVPANHVLTPLGPVAEQNPYGSVGDLRLLPDPATRAGVAAGGDGSALELMLCDIVETDGGPWECCPRTILRDALAVLRGELGLTAVVSFEHEFQLLRSAPTELPFSLRALRGAEPFVGDVFAALGEAGAEPERVFAEYAAHQLEIPVGAADAMAAADRAVIVREVVHEIARRHGLRASFAPLLDAGDAGNGVHVHISLHDGDGSPALYDPAGDGALSALGGSFAAGILDHAHALCALTAPSPLSYQRLQPHRWSAGAACLAQRNREALLRIPPLVALGGLPEAPQMRLEYRAADAAANPYLALAAIVLAGIDGVRRGLASPPILDRDPGELSPEEAEQFGVGALPASLPEAMEAMARDEVARGWLSPLTYEAYLAIKQSEIEFASGRDEAEVTERYARIY